MSAPYWAIDLRAARPMVALRVESLRSMSASDSPVPIESPCTKLCTLDARSGLCLGCGRRMAEIERWSRMSAAERSRIMAELPGRLAALPGAGAKVKVSP
jgi:predicted Fe-S protein YdhL (DUF1289 family)